MSALRPSPSTPLPPHGVAVFVLERFSKHSSAVATGVQASAVDSKTGLHQGQLHSRVPGATVQTPPTAVAGRWPDHLGPAHPQSGLGLEFGGGGGESGTRSRSSGFGQFVPETKEQSTWIHLSAPQHLVTLKIHRPNPSSACSSTSTTQASTSKLALPLALTTSMSLAQPGLHPGAGSLDPREPHPELLIQSGQTTLERIDLDTSSLRQTKLKGLVKGNMIGFRYCCCSPGSNVAENHKFQVKFQSQHDCGQCASILSLFIECRTTSHHSGTGNENTEPHRSCDGFKRTECRLSREDGPSQDQVCGILSQQSESVISTMPQIGPQLTQAPRAPVAALDHNRSWDFDQLLKVSDKDLQGAIDIILVHPTFAQLASKIQKILRSST